ncbi:uncharacterized protein LOC127712709 isoform X1 [Mytilus californianus]|uniref:uncharacterized protein LOC127712709 isoform X1 n=1 Tax=Mytilus californianus TaxID=6549 RepID=UPI002248112B|nr:uncharacterized protein LOC127712709 isoform X1 [Mytilus californianus]
MWKASPRCVSGAAVSKLLQCTLSDKPCNDYDFCERLWTETKDTRMKALNTNFVQGVKGGMLHPTSFGAYTVQDAVYCQKAQESLSVAAKREEMGPLKIFLEHESTDYKSYYEDLFDKWHIRDGEAIYLGKECQEYVDTVADVASKDDAYYMLVALIPCARLWPWLGQQLTAAKDDFGAYTDWVNSNFNPSSEGYKKLEVRVNAAFSKQEIDEKKALSIYSKCMNGEAGFFGSVPI